MVYAATAQQILFPRQQQTTCPDSSMQLRTPGSVLFSRYRVLKIAGYGTTGVVYCCTDTLVREEQVAVKLFEDGEAKSPHARRRYRNEIRLARIVIHPGIIKVRDALEDRTSIGYVMDYVPGGNLQQLLESGTALKADDALSIFSGIVRAVAALHCAGVMHRDIKAENIMLSAAGSPQIIDFGLAVEAEVATAAAESYDASSIHYLSPETITRDYYDHRSEVYALGVLGYRLLTGAFPFPASTGRDFVIERTRSDPQSIENLNPGAPKEFARIVSACLHRDPMKRYASAEAIRRAIDPLLAPGDRPNTSRSVQNNPGLLKDKSKEFFARFVALAQRTVSALHKFGTIGVRRA